MSSCPTYPGPCGNSTRCSASRIEGAQYHDAESCDAARCRCPMGARLDIDLSFLRVFLAKPTNPTQQPGTITAFSVAPDRFAKSAARKDRVRPRRQKM